MPETRQKDKVGEKSSATPLEKMMTPKQDAPSLQAMLKSFENKLSTVASQEYIESKFKESESVLSKYLEKVKAEIQVQIQRDSKEVKKSVRDLQEKIEQVNAEQSKDKTLISDLSLKIENLEKENVSLKKSNQKLNADLQDRLVLQQSHSNRINDLD